MNSISDYNLHFGVAEKGKVFALHGNHREALRYYKEALRMCQSLPNADVFFQHYSLCAMESLEKMESYQEVIDFCEKCLEFLKDKEELQQQPIFRKYVASIIERKGIQFLYLNEREEAIGCFKEVKQLMGMKIQSLANELLNWCLRGYSISPNQIQNIQNKYGYFTVRKENVNERIAIELPKMINPY